jgi:poly(3-hydroxybutyrate) depolymerase
MRFFALATTLTLAFPVGAHAQEILDDSLPPGANFDKAQFRFWAPDGIAQLSGVLVLVPGSNGDGRPMAQDTIWQKFAADHRLAIVACRFTDKPHEQGFIEEYIAVSRGSGDAPLSAISRFGERSGHREIIEAPLLMWGMSAGGQFNYEFVAWKPERVMAFAVNKGGIYYSALLSRAAREVPGMLFVGGKDLAFRNNTIAGLFAVNRRGGALWALAEEPGVGHVIGKSRDVSMVFFDEVLKLRTRNPDGTLAKLEEKSGLLGDLTARTFAPLGDGRVPNYPTAWLPSERVARAWQDMVTSPSDSTRPPE